ncbi:MAG: HigA family addiction module antitoxin [Planctomycetota bacterium]|jgi:addiction module HigA family antidote
MTPVKLPGFAVHPGEILIEEFMKPMNITQKALAERLGVSFRRINEICRGRRAVTAETALVLSRAFGTSAQLWMNLQAAYDLFRANEKTDLRGIRPFKQSA